MLMNSFGRMSKVRLSPFTNSTSSTLLGSVLIRPLLASEKLGMATLCPDSAKPGRAKLTSEERTELLPSLTSSGWALVEDRDALRLGNMLRFGLNFVVFCAVCFLITVADRLIIKGGQKKSFFWHFQHYQDYLQYKFFYSKIIKITDKVLSLSKF